MDNKNDAFEGMYPFRGKKDKNSTNLSKSIIGHGEDRLKKSNKQANDKKTREPRKRVSSTNKIDKQIDPVPLILPRPKVVEKQIKRKKNKQKDFEDKHVNEFKQTKTLSNDKSKADKKKESNEDEIVQRKERISSKVNEFSSMLKESVTYDEKFIERDDSSSLEEGFSAKNEEEAPEWDESHSNKVEATSIEEEFLTMFDEIIKGDISLEEAFSAMLKENFTERDKSKVFKVEDTLREKGFLAQLDETSSKLVESDSANEEISSLQNESPFAKEEFFNQASSRRKRFDSLLDKFSSMLEYSSSHDESENELLIKDDGEEEYCKTPLELTLSDNCSPKSYLPIVKLPVLLANVNIDIDIFDSFELTMSIVNITKIEWSLDSLECRVLLPSTTVFLKGILIADIQYVNEKLKHTLHSVKVPVPWDKTITIDWLYPPDLSGSSQREFMFGSQSETEISSHYECCQQYADQIHHELCGINFVWSEALDSQEATSKLSILGRANLSINLMQQQYIDLNTK